MNDNYARLLKLIRGSGDGEDVGTGGLQIAEMTSKNAFKVDGIKVDKDDILMLTFDIKDHVDSEGNHTKHEYKDLKAGDEVLVYQIDEELFILIGKLEEV